MTNESDPFYEPPAVHYDNGVRFGTVHEMIEEIRKLRLERADLLKKWVDFPTPDGGLSIDTDSAAAFLREVADHFEHGLTSARLREIAKMIDLVAPTIKSLSAKNEALRSQIEERSDEVDAAN